MSPRRSGWRLGLWVLIVVWLLAAASLAILGGVHSKALWAVGISGILAAGLPLLAARVDKLLDRRSRAMLVGAERMPVAGESVRPQQLPRDLADFTGRSEFLDHLRILLRPSRRRGVAGAATVVVISGAAGMGKTALAVHAAHRAVAAFPDGQLYVSLQGQTTERRDPSEALQDLLRGRCWTRTGGCAPGILATSTRTGT